MSLKIGYFGSPIHSKNLLEMLVNAGHIISFVVTNIDKPVGRKQTITPTPVKEFAMKNSIPVLQSPRLRTDESVQNQILEMDADLHIVYAYGSIIPNKVFESPKFGSINLHGSLLPKFRGASPVQSVLLSGANETGFTIQTLATEVDSGNIISQKSWVLGVQETTGSLLQRITNEGGMEILQLLDILKTSQVFFPSTPQNHNEATHCKKIVATDRPIHWDRPAFEIHNQIRALNPDPLAFALFREKRVIFIESSLPNQTEENIPIPEGTGVGSFFLYQKKRLFCLCGDGNLLGIECLQPEGKKPMKGFEFFNGARVIAGERFT
ncbi:methionyl-tRNA formyltransferase [Leptospira sp. 96542]|nr:methionyl-tRNA formyltransferase [Leptospira sp. 96542]